MILQRDLENDNILPEAVLCLRCCPHADKSTASIFSSLSRDVSAPKSVHLHPGCGRFCIESVKKKKNVNCD